MTAEDGPYAGLGPYGIAVTALERILELDTGWMYWDEARAIAGEAHGLALRATGVADAAEREPQPAPEPIMLRDALAVMQRERDEAEDELLREWPRCPAGCNCRIGVEDDPDRNECGCDGPCNGGDAQPAPELAAAMAALQRDLADAEAEIGRWPRCPSGCRCRVGTNDADALECGCDGPCTAGWDAPAAERDQLRDRLAVLAASLDADALATQPSKKSQIQADAARRIREALA